LTGFTVELGRARSAFLEQVSAFVAAVADLTDHQLLAASRCHGWAVLDVLVHVRGGLEECCAASPLPPANQ
jgi:hypothetical protein